jgi:hypothetical protein
MRRPAAIIPVIDGLRHRLSMAQRALSVPSRVPALVQVVASTCCASAALRKNKSHLLWLTMSVISASTLQSRQHQPTHCSSSVRKPLTSTSTSPCTFGTSIRAYSNSTTTTTTATGTSTAGKLQDLISYQKNSSPLSLEEKTLENENCPYCQKYSQGPCGKLFQKWLKCTDQHPGKDPSNPQVDWHLTACATFAQELARCLNQHESFYQTPFQPQQNENPATLQELDDDEEEQALHQAWQRLVEDELEAIPRQSFPSSCKPIMEFRSNDRLAVAMVNMVNDQQQPLLLVYIQDVSTTTHHLLSAGSCADLFVYKERGVLKCHLPESTTHIQVSALYESSAKHATASHQERSDQIILTHVAHVPIP